MYEMCAYIMAVYLIIDEMMYFRFSTQRKQEHVIATCSDEMTAGQNRYICFV